MKKFIRLVLIVFALGQLEQRLGVVQPVPQAGQPAQLGVQVGQPAGHLLRPVLVSPKPGVGGLLTQAVRLGQHSSGVEHRLDAGELRRQCRDLIGGIGTCHAG